MMGEAIHVGAGDLQEIQVAAFQFCCQPKKAVNAILEKGKKCLYGSQITII